MLRLTLGTTLVAAAFFTHTAVAAHGGFKAKPYIEYWLKKEGKLTMVISLRQLAKQFDDQSDLFKKYVKEHKVKFEDPESQVELIKFLEQN